MNLSFEKQNHYQLGNSNKISTFISNSQVHIACNSISKEIEVRIVWWTMWPLLASLKAVTSHNIPPKLVLNSNLVKSPLSLTYFSVAQSFWNFAQSMAVILPCSVQNFKTNGQLKWVMKLNQFSLDLIVRLVWQGFPSLEQIPGH